MRDSRLYVYSEMVISSKDEAGKYNQFIDNYTNTFKCKGIALKQSVKISIKNTKMLQRQQMRAVLIHISSRYAVLQYIYFMLSNYCHSSIDFLCMLCKQRKTKSTIFILQSHLDEKRIIYEQVFTFAFSPSTLVFSMSPRSMRLVFIGWPNNSTAGPYLRNMESDNLQYSPLSSFSETN